MSKIDLRELLNRALAANSNQPIIDQTAAAAAKPVPRNDARTPTPRATPSRPHRALRPRRRS